MASENRDHLDLEDRLKRLNEIGVALSAKRDLIALLELILQEARSFTRADAGTLYLVRGDFLSFEITQNNTLQSFMGGSHGKLDIPPVPRNKESVSGYAAVTGETLNIADVYTDQKYRFEGPKQYDRMTGYRTTSMLVVPMQDHEDQVIGVVQLLNATDPDNNQVKAFSTQDEALIQSLASQAAVAINNVRLIRETEQLFESFVQVMATAIDERSPYTGGHIRRVMEMAMVVAEAINNCDEGPLAAVSFDADELNELRIAAWMHDIGKITTPEWVVDKPTKLTTIYDRIDLVKTRLLLAKKSAEVEVLEQKVAALEAGQEWSAAKDAECARYLAEFDEDIDFLERINLPGEYMEEEDLQRLRQVAAKSYNAGKASYLTENEVENLSILKGSLTDAERQKINDHAAMSIKMLAQIPFTRKLQQVPAIAGAHHENLDGSGYPLGLKAEDISLQARILALVDIFESVSADDRPYRAKPMPREVVLRILQEDVDSNYLDRDLFDLFMKEKLYLRLDHIKERMALEARQKG